MLQVYHRIQLQTEITLSISLASLRALTFSFSLPSISWLFLLSSCRSIGKFHLKNFTRKISLRKLHLDNFTQKILLWKFHSKNFTWKISHGKFQKWRNLSKIVLVLLSASVKRFDVSHMRNFFLYYPNHQLLKRVRTLHTKISTGARKWYFH